jgi:hypothetical protein
MFGNLFQSRIILGSAICRQKIFNFGKIAMFVPQNVTHVVIIIAD